MLDCFVASLLAMTVHLGYDRSSQRPEKELRAEDLPWTTRAVIPAI
jgi:hypothetical protein